MNRLMETAMFLTWWAALIWAGLELEKIKFLQTVYAMLHPGWERLKTQPAGTNPVRIQRIPIVGKG